WDPAHPLEMGAGPCDDPGGGHTAQHRLEVRHDVLRFPDGVTGTGLIERLPQVVICQHTLLAEVIHPGPEILDRGDAAVVETPVGVVVAGAGFSEPQPVGEQDLPEVVEDGVVAPAGGGPPVPFVAPLGEALGRVQERTPVHVASWEKRTDSENAGFSCAG